MANTDDKEMPMDRKSVFIKIYRHDPPTGGPPSYSEYNVPFQKGMSVMNALDYIYENLDSTIAYYDHAGCSLGICGRCVGRINGKSGLFCQTLITGDIEIEPVNTDRVVRDLVVGQKKKYSAN